MNNAGSDPIRKRNHLLHEGEVAPMDERVERAHVHDGSEVAAEREAVRIVSALRLPVEDSRPELPSTD